MSRERVETVKRIYDEWAHGNVREGVELYDPSIVFVSRPDFADPGVFYGKRALQGFMRDFLASWTDFTSEGTEFLDAGDTVVVAVTQRAIGRSSGAPVELSYYQVWTFRGDKVVRLENVMERAEALKAAGLSG